MSLIFPKKINLDTKYRQIYDVERNKKHLSLDTNQQVEQLFFKRITKVFYFYEIKKKQP